MATNVQTANLPPVPSTSAILVKVPAAFISQPWNQWFIQLRTKVNVINDLLVTLAGASTPAEAFNALSPLTTQGDMLTYESGNNVRLPIGTTGQVLTVVGGIPSWQTSASSSPLTTKGDLYTYTTTNARLPVGTNGQVLSANSSTSTGLQWVTPTIGVTSLNSLTGALTLVAGSNISITPSGTNITIASSSGSGTVTSVSIAAPGQFSVSGNPITSSGTITLAWAAQSLNVVFAGPGSGGVGAVPSFRALVAADIPSLPYVTSVAISGGSTGLTVSGSPITSSGTITISGTLDIANGGTGTTTATGSGELVLQTSPTINTPNITGIIGGTNASTGSVGEFLTATAGSTALTSNTFTNLTTITLTPGDWDVWGGVTLMGSAAVITNAFGGINNISATAPGAGYYFQYNGTAVSNFSLPCTQTRYNVTTNTTIYLIGFAGFATGSVNAFGVLNARRVR